MSAAIGQKTTITPERLLAAAEVLEELADEPILGLVNGAATYFTLTSEQLRELSNRLEPVTPEYRWK